MALFAALRSQDPGRALHDCAVHSLIEVNGSVAKHRCAHWFEGVRGFCRQMPLCTVFPKADEVAAVSVVQRTMLPWWWSWRTTPM